MDNITFLRQFRIGPFTLFDTFLGYLGIFVLSPLLTKLFALCNVRIPLTSWLWWMLPISAVFHLIFRQQTPLMKTMSEPLGFLLVSIVLIAMVYMGARNCRRIA